MAENILEKDMDSMPKELAALGRGRRPGVLIPWAHVVGTRTERPGMALCITWGAPTPGEWGQMAGEENSGLFSPF